MRFNNNLLQLRWKISSFNSLYEIQQIVQHTLAHSSVTFNSLYEIHKLPCSYDCKFNPFQFSLWDSRFLHRETHSHFYLSILFMRFLVYFLAKLMRKNLYILSILFMRFKSYYNLWWRKWKDYFQFSLWDSQLTLKMKIW